MNINLENVNCDLCHSNEFTLVARQTDLIHKSTNEFFNVVRCKNCGFNYTNPRPTFESISDFYIADYNFHKKNSPVKLFIKKFISKIVKVKIFYYFSFIFPNKLNQLLIAYLLPKIKDPVIDYINSYKGKNKINFIDIGCGSGSDVHFWGYESSIKNLSSKLNVIGIEPSEQSRSFLKKSNIKVYSKIDLVKKNKKFELIRLNWSLEHVHYPRDYFKFIQEHLAKNGIAIICVPNNNGFIYKIDKNCLELPIHLYHFDKESLKQYAEMFNLEIINFQTFSYPGMYSYSKKIGILNTDLDFEKMTLLEAINFMKFHRVIDKAEMGNDILAILKKKIS